MSKKNYISLIVIFLSVISVLYLEGIKKMWQNEARVVFWDVKSYYAYLPAIIINGDPLLKFVDESPQIYGDKFWPETAENGNKVIMTSMGLSMLYLPFFLVGHLVAYLTGAEMSGYSAPYFFFLLLSSLFYLFLGLLCLRKILLKYFSDKITAITLAAIYFGTNIVWYSIYEATMSHVYSFSLFAFFLYYTIKWHENQNLKTSIILGLIFGLIALVRPTNAIIVLFFIFYNISSFKDLIINIKLFIKNYKFILIISVFAFIILIPQLIYWKYVTNHWFYYSYGNKGNFFFGNPQIINGLFSYRKGWFIYTPIMLIAVISIPLLLRNIKINMFFIPILIFVTLNIYIIFSWWSWWYGGGLGIRALIDSYAIMSIPLAAFLDWVAKRKLIIKISSYSVFTIFLLLGLFTNFQYYYGAIHWDSMTKEAYWDSFLKAKGSPNLKFLIRTPNYEKAMIGIQEIIEPEIIEIDTKKYFYSEKIFCDAETIDTTQKLLTTEKGDYFFGGITCITNEKAFSGKNSIKLNDKNPFGFTIYLANYKPKDKYLISVKRFKQNNFGFLVIQAEDVNLMYLTYNVATKIENSEWMEISTILEIPETINGMGIKIYCYNPETTDVYFDDLKILKIK